MSWVGTLSLVQRLLPWLGLAAIPLAILAGVQTLDRNSWHRKADQFELSWHQEENAHSRTILNYETAAKQAREADAANKKRVDAEQKAINEQRDQAYEARLADARARADRLRHELEAARAHPGGPGAAPMPGVSNAAGGPDGAADEGGFSLRDRLTATEQAIRLDELQKWVRQQVGVDVQGDRNK